MRGARVAGEEGKTITIKYVTTNDMHLVETYTALMQNILKGNEYV